MKRYIFNKKIIYIFSFCLLFLLILFCFPSSHYIYGVGGFLPAEHTVKFLDASDRKPIENLEVVVTDKYGRLALGYPVSNFSGRGSIKSNHKGEVILYHIVQNIEFSYKSGYYLYFIKYESGRFPKYKVNYYFKENLVFIHDYDDLDRDLLEKHKDGDLFNVPRIEKTITIITENGLTKKTTEKFIPNNKTIILSF